MKRFNDFLTEKLKISQYRELYRKIDKEYKSRYEDWFNGEWRIYLPLSGAVADPLYQEVNRALSKNDYEIADWNNGLAKSKKSNRTQRIGRLLTSLKEDSLLKKFNERHKGKEVSTEKEEDLLVVISRHPYDIASMSTERLRYTKEGEPDVTHLDKYYSNPVETREKEKLIDAGYKKEGWTSCKHFVDGANNHYIPTEIDSGCLIAYVIKPDDKNIKKPLSRLLIIPLYEEDNPDNTVLYVGDKFYGKSIPSFKTVVEEWLEEHQGEIDIREYCLDADNIYNDDYRGELNTIGVNQLRRALENAGWVVEELDNDSCTAYSDDLSILNIIFMTRSQQKKTPNRVSRLFDDYDLDNIDPESWQYSDNLKRMMTLIDDDIKEAIIKLYKQNGGEEEDWEDIIEELDEYTDITDDLTLWYAHEEYIKTIDALREQYEDALRSQTPFYIKNMLGYHIFVHVERDEYDGLMMMLDDEWEFNFDVDTIETEAYNNIESPDINDLNEFLKGILDL